MSDPVPGPPGNDTFAMPRQSEHDDTTAAATVAVFTRTGDFTDVTSRRDLAGRPRFVTATRTG